MPFTLVFGRLRRFQSASLQPVCLHWDLSLEAGLRWATAVIPAPVVDTGRVSKEQALAPVHYIRSHPGPIQIIRTILCSLKRPITTRLGLVQDLCKTKVFHLLPVAATLLIRTLLSKAIFTRLLILSRIDVILPGGDVCCDLHADDLYLHHVACSLL